MPIPTRVHGILDYLFGIALIAAPFILGFTGGPKQWVMVWLGIIIIVLSLLTDYEASAVRLIPMPVHLGFDVLAGIFLTMSPWLYDFAYLVSWPHVVLGLALIIVATLTNSQPSYSVDVSQRSPYPPAERRH